MTVSEIYYQQKVQEYIKNDYGTKQWVQVSGHRDIYGTDAVFWCGFIPKEHIKKSLSNVSWDLTWHSCKPGFKTFGETTVYKSRLEDDKEPLLFYRNFYGLALEYVDISQEFILLYNLYYDKKYKSYFVIHENGKKEEIVRYKDDTKIEIKVEYLKKYASAKQLAIVLLYDIYTHFSGQLSDYGLSSIRETVTQGNVSYLINGGEISSRNIVYSRILGKKIIAPDPIEECGFWPYVKVKKYEEYIIGKDEHGSEISYTSNPDLLNDYYDANPKAPMYLTPVFFSREVLQKYYANPELYTITDGYLSCQSLWGIEIDNHHKDVVCAYLGDLGRDLPEEDQKYWKLYNILTDDSLSIESYQRDFLSKTTESTVIEHQFKRDYKILIKQWEKHFGWPLFKTLSNEDVCAFNQIRRPLTTSQSEFDQLVLLLCKIMIDALNEKELSKNFDTDNTLRGIGKLEQCIKNNDIKGYEEHITFLKKLWNLRSSAVHGKGKNYSKISNKFEIEEMPLPDIFDKILQDADAFLRFMLYILPGLSKEL